MGMIKEKDIYRRDNVIDKKTADTIIQELSKDKQHAKMFATMNTQYNEKELEKSWDDTLQDKHEEVLKKSIVEKPKFIIDEEERKRLRMIGYRLNYMPTPVGDDTIIELERTVDSIGDIIIEERYSTDRGIIHSTNNKELNIGDKVLYKKDRYRFNVDNKRYAVVNKDNILAIIANLGNKG